MHLPRRNRLCDGNGAIRITVKTMESLAHHIVE